MIAEQLGSLREYVKSRIKEEPLRRKILKQAAAEAFSHERILSQDEINTIIRQVLNHVQLVEDQLDMTHTWSFGRR